MSTLVAALLFLHFMGLALGFAGGIGLAQVGPRLVAAAPKDRAFYAPLARSLSLIASVGFGLLLVTGPLMVWLKFGGVGGLSHWFWAKMLFVASAVIAFGLQKMAAVRFRKGNEAAAKGMIVFGRLTGVSAVLAVLFAVMTFN